MTELSHKSFFDQVYKVVAQIPYGRVMSYGQIAAFLGRPREARIVGWALRTCPEELPWQRVVMADGSVTGGDWEEARRELLAQEGVEFLCDGRVDMASYRWTPEPSALASLEDMPDEALRAEIASELASLEVPDD